MVDTKHVNALSNGLKEILRSEIGKGNRVVETFYGWTMPATLFVFLEKPFIEMYNTKNTGIEYNELNDRHYWKAEYYDSVYKQTLACRF